MLRNQFLLGFVAFGISFSISWASDRNVNKALATGLTTLPAAVIASMMVDRRSHPKLEARIVALKNHIRVLKKRHAETYQAYAELAAEREQLAIESSSEQPPVMLRLPPAPTPSTVPKKPISWDLSMPMASDPTIDVKPYELPTEIQSLPKAAPKAESVTAKSPAPNAQLSQVLAEATAAKRKIEVSLKSLQRELDQLQGQVSSHRHTRDTLVQELVDLKRQQQQLEAESAILEKDVNDLKRCQKELDQHLSDSEARRKELDQGSHPLQIALKQLQNQVGTLQDELRRLEIQVSDRRQQKDDLDHQLATLTVQLQSLQEQRDLLARSPAEKNGKSHPTPKKDASNGNASKHLNPRPVVTVSASQPEPVNAQTIAAKSPEPAKSEQSSAESDGWDELIDQLPEYEIQVLRAIVEQSNPAGLIKKIAEDNLTMPEMLIDSINERALETIGDIIVEPGTNSSSAAIAREHLRTVKKLLKTYRAF